MRDWNLGIGDPLCLTLAADCRLGEADYLNDIIWELELGGGDPSSVTLQTTYGMRARAMRLFPRFVAGGKILTDPAEFHIPPRLHRFFPNFLLVSFSPFAGIDVLAEYWVPTSRTVASRLTLTNSTQELQSFTLELCGVLVPVEGLSLSTAMMESVHVMSGRTADLSPVIFLTGGPKAGPGPYASLSLDLVLSPGGARRLTWSHAVTSNLQESFDLARRTAASLWEAERARVELLNAGQMVDIKTGNPDWDAAFVFSQGTAFRSFFSQNQHLPWPSFVLSRQPDHGASKRGDGKDYPTTWLGQTPLEAYYIESILVGAPELAEGLWRNFLAVQGEDGSIDGRPGLGGQRGLWLALPILTRMAWNTFEKDGDLSKLRQVYPGLRAFFRSWFEPSRDRDRDGFPEWEHVAQTGFEDNPAFNLWQAQGRGLKIPMVETPALTALLYSECLVLLKIAGALGFDSDCASLKLQADALHAHVEDCWNADASLYHMRDRDTHSSSPGVVVFKGRGNGSQKITHKFGQHNHLLVHVDFGNPKCHPEITVRGHAGRKRKSEKMTRSDFQWGTRLAVAVSRERFTRLDQVEVGGIRSRDKVTIYSLDFSSEDHTLFLPLWARIPDFNRAKELVSQNLKANGRFYRTYGVSACPNDSYPATDSVGVGVFMPWNHIIGEGLLAYGLIQETVQLVECLMSAVVASLKQQRAFYGAYHAESGAGMGVRNTISGLAPLGLFLQTLGVQILSAERVRLSWLNPFPWVVELKYRGLKVTCSADRTRIEFPERQEITISDSMPCIVSAGV